MKFEIRFLYHNGTIIVNYLLDSLDAKSMSFGSIFDADFECYRLRYFFPHFQKLLRNYNVNSISSFLSHKS